MKHRALIVDDGRLRERLSVLSLHCAGYGWSVGVGNMRLCGAHSAQLYGARALVSSFDDFCVVVIGSTTENGRLVVSTTAQQYWVLICASVRLRPSALCLHLHGQPLMPWSHLVKAEKRTTRLYQPMHAAAVLFSVNDND